MMHFDYGRLIGYAWETLLGVWLVSWFTAKRTVRAESSWQNWGRMFLMWAVFYFLYFSPPRSAFLHYRLVPQTDDWVIGGTVLTLAGIAFTIWARFALGRNWSAKVTIKREHELIVSGPYRIVRNPIYTGVFFALVGTSIALGQVRHFLVLPVLLASWISKIVTEQRLLTEQFGEQYVEYCRKVKAFIPYVV
ncbi:Isoprenylcysteine carboxyl methyltransferase [Candidatus Koribacter versatilis Ellin345]|uniref:Isoprenylcysteine carboxyl methyltransferase n=1 Tax=Koribacter versatilis (strain Ellin345) TaxID=204669 RepID=Q1IQ97_KORVE|nr:isoprenylcysteine carboxylmethyltransferase family protein [Candidatus Koribacter versatilis]ABF40953.1 Isoprenylcysteine carboxyl methyltransferase [Candidatus Koribacter versatilis Ellin345]